MFFLSHSGSNFRSRRSTWMVSEGEVGKVQVFCGFRFGGSSLRLAFVKCYDLQVDSCGLKYFDSRTQQCKEKCIFAEDILEPLAYGVRDPEQPHLQYVFFPSFHHLDPDKVTS